MQPGRSTITTLAALGLTLVSALVSAAIARADDSWICPPAISSIKNPVAPDARSIESGRALAAGNGCVDCHGAEGYGNGPAAASIKPRPANWHSDRIRAESDSCLFWKLTTGRRPMPGSASISEQQRWDLVNFIRSLQRK